MTSRKPTAVDRRAQAAAAGHLGNERSARSYFVDTDGAVRATAFSALVRLNAVTADEVARAMNDDDPVVRRTACEHGAALPTTNFTPLLDDPDDSVVEAAAYALGELEDRRGVDRLCEIARQHQDPLCRESAIAALGAIGDERAKPVVLAALGDVPAIRRRAVIALSAFDGDEVILALNERLSDRDWQVRQAAEDVLALSDEAT